MALLLHLVHFTQVTVWQYCKVQVFVCTIILYLPGLMEDLSRTTLMPFGLPADKLAFVGFKGSFHPDWVHLEVDTNQAKIHQVLPVPVVRKMKLWVAGIVGRTAKRLCSLQILTHIHSP